MGRERGRTVLPWLVLRLTLGAIRVAGEIVGQSALVNAQLGIPQKDRATACGIISVRKRTQPTVAEAAFHWQLSEGPLERPMPTVPGRRRRWGPSPSAPIEEVRYGALPF